MNALHAHQALLAAANRRAVAKTTRRHIHLSPRPFVIAGYHLAGDPGAPLALMWGSSRHDVPRLMVVPEPRNRALRFEALSEFASAFIEYLSQFQDHDDEGACLDAPQLVVPNAATADWLGGVVGRFTRNLRTDGDPPAPPSVPLAGKHLSFFADLLPGSCLLLPVTTLLTIHWQTGQLPSEDLNLAALLGWIDPPSNLDGPQAARVGEESSPAGPISDPDWDAETLSELNQDWHAARNDADRLAVRQELEREIRELLEPTWADSWQALDLVGSLPAADHVTSRWQRDLENWTTHCARIAQGEAYFRNIPTPVQAAGRLRHLEDRTESFQREMAWDDPLVMATVVASGEALAGRVVTTDRDHRSLNVNGNSVLRPLISVEPSLGFDRPAGTTLFLSTHPEVTVKLLTTDSSGLVQAEVVKGANQKATIERLPEVDENVVLSPFGPSESHRRTKVDDVPWTHQLEVEEYQ